MAEKDCKYDVIIIGGGIGGLFAGCNLAKNGLKVLLLEKHSKVGGCVASAKRGAFVFDVGAHLIGSCNKTGVLGNFLKQLGVILDFIQLNPADRFHFKNFTFDVPADFDLYMKKLKQMFPKEEKQITSFFKEILHIFRNFSKEKVIQKYENFTYGEFLNQYFKNNKLKAILSAQSLYIGLPPGRASLLGMVLMLVSYLRDGVYYPKGGTQNFPDALLKRFTELSGEVLVSTDAEKILIENNVAMGVYADGKEYFADFIISNSDAKRTFLDLVGSDELPKKFINKIFSMRNSFSFFSLQLALKNINKSKVESVIGWHHSDINIDECYMSSFYIFSPTLYDETIADKDSCIVEFMMPFPYTAFEYESWIPQKWNKTKKDLTEKTINLLESILQESISDKIIFKIAATPKTIERYTCNSYGSLYGWEMTPDQTQNRRLGFVTPIKRLFLVGHWTTPGCGIASVAVSGWQVSSYILNNSYKESVKV